MTTEQRRLAAILVADVVGTRSPRRRLSALSVPVMSSCETRRQTWPQLKLLGLFARPRCLALCLACRFPPLRLRTMPTSEKPRRKFGWSSWKPSPSRTWRAAATYTSDAVTVSPTGVQEINAKVIEGWFANGPRTIDTTFDQALPLSADTALGIGTFRLTGKTLKGEPVEVTARWANTYVRQDGQWKIRMATMIPQAPPPK